MRRLILSLIAIGPGLVLLGSAGAMPPDDLATYCRATYGAVQHQVRCLYTERAARERLGRRQAAVDPEAWSQCQGSAGSWTAMESCVAQPAAGAGTASGAGGGQAQRGGAPDGAAATAGARTPAQATPSPAAGQPPIVSGSPSTVILGPRQGGTAAAEANRPTRSVSEAEAERQLKGVLERSGESSARCTKKQYGPGWVTVCE
jgi:hypothetical protein